MTIGLDLGGVPGKVVPDKQLTRKSTPKVLLATFGDGYEQRVADGINSVKETYSLSFRTRTAETIDDMARELENNKGIANFTLTLPDTNDTSRTGEKDVKVVCVDYSTIYEYDGFYSLTVNLRRVFEA